MIVRPERSFRLGASDGACNVYYLFAAENTDAGDAGASGSQRDSSRLPTLRVGPAISGLFGYGLRPFRERVLRILNCEIPPRPSFRFGMCYLVYSEMSWPLLVTGI